MRSCADPTSHIVCSLRVYPLYPPWCTFGAGMWRLRRCHPPTLINNYGPGGGAVPWPHGRALGHILAQNHLISATRTIMNKTYSREKQSAPYELIHLVFWNEEKKALGQTKKKPKTKRHKKYMNKYQITLNNVSSI